MDVNALRYSVNGKQWDESSRSQHKKNHQAVVQNSLQRYEACWIEVSYCSITAHKAANGISTSFSLGARFQATPQRWNWTHYQSIKEPAGSHHSACGEDQVWRGWGPVGQQRLLGTEVQIFVYVEIVAGTLTSDPTPAEQIKTVRYRAGRAQRCRAWQLLIDTPCRWCTRYNTSLRCDSTHRTPATPQEIVGYQYDEHIHKSYWMFEPWLFTQTMRYEWWTIWPLETN